MKFGSILSVCLIVSFSVSGDLRHTHAVEVAAADSPVDEVKATIKKMIALIDEGKMLELLEKYTDVPAEIRTKLAGRIEQEKLDQMKEFLSQALRMTPKVEDDGKTVIFQNDEFPRPMKFVKSGENWVMKDK